MVSPGKIEFRKVNDPGPLKENEVLLRIRKIGICGSDIHVYHGEHPATPYPVVQGHEYSATVEAVGEKVTGIMPGMRATARPQIVCGKCGPCRKGQYNVCQELKVEGFQAPGCAQDLFIVDKDKVIAFPDTMTFEQGALIEPAAVGAHSTSRVTDIKGKNVVVSGAGTIGNLVAQAAKGRGARKVLITDISDYRLDIAKRCGIEHTVNVSENSFESAVTSVFGEEGFQVGFDAAGVQSSIDVLMKNIEKGGEIVILGVYSEKPVINMHYLMEHELKIIGSLMYRHEDYEEAMEMLSSGKISTEPLITRSYPFEQYDEAYKYIDSQKGKSMKVMIDV